MANLVCPDCLLSFTHAGNYTVHRKRPHVLPCVVPGCAARMVDAYSQSAAKRAGLSRHLRDIHGPDTLELYRRRGTLHQSLDDRIAAIQRQLLEAPRGTRLATVRSRRRALIVLLHRRWLVQRSTV